MSQIHQKLVATYKADLKLASSPLVFTDYCSNKLHLMMTDEDKILKDSNFHTFFKPIHSKCKRVPLPLLDSVKSELNRMEKEGHIVNLDKCVQNCFISPLVITRKKNGRTKLALHSKLNDQTFENNYQLPHIHELIDKLALQLSNKESGEVFFSSLV